MYYKLIFATVLYSTLMYGCGSGALPGQATALPGGPDSPAIISVSLNDAFTTVTPNGSEKVQLTDARYFNPPNSITIVSGAYAGHAPGQYQHGRISVGAEQCQYQALSINDTVLSLRWCSGGLGPNTYLAAGSVIELTNFNAPGFLLEANFVLVK